MTAANNQDQPPEGINRRRLVVFLLALPLFFALFMFLPAGTWAWDEGLALHRGVPGTLAVLAALYLWRVNPEVLAARINPHQGTKRWDKILLGFFLPAVAGDHSGGGTGRRAVSLVSRALVGLRARLRPARWSAWGSLTWAEAVNKFFEPTVRIQTDRGQKVIDTGPYAIVRHPGYVGWLPPVAWASP